MTTEWRIVPVKLTSEMIGEAYAYCADDAVGCWDDILAAAPRASEDEALVEDVVNAVRHTSTKSDWMSLDGLVRAILKALEKPHD